MNFKNRQNCYVIAEAGVNHNSSIKMAFELVDVAKAAGADAIKFQLFDIDEQVSNIAINAPYQRKGSKKKAFKEMAKDYELDWLEHLKIKKHCDEIGIDYLSSCFDNNAIDFLIDKIGSELIKISSGEITNYKLIEYASTKNKTIILSTGMATISEVEGAVNKILSNKNFKKELILLHCTSNYPAQLESLNLNAIHTLRDKFQLIVGYSDHSLGNKAAMASLALGAKVIEKHFTLNKSLPGPDHSMALDPIQLKDFIEEIRMTEKMLGNGIKIPTVEEIEMKKVFRRGVISMEKILAGQVLSIYNIGIKRPLIGIDAVSYEDVLNKKIKIDVEKDVPITWDMLESDI